MAIERYCTMKDCPGGDGCLSELRKPGGSCAMEYVADPTRPECNWKGEGPPPRRWTALNGTIVYRSYADYCDD